MDEFIDWVHPSVRDVVIEHLASSNDDRQRFLRTTNEAGMALALSIGGGSGGERVRPLLQTPEDWAILSERLLETVAAGDEGSHAGLMRRIIDAIDMDDVSTTAMDKLQTVAKNLLDAVTTEWNRRNVPVTPEAWRVLFRLQVVASIWSPAPNPAKSWDHLLNAAAGSDVDDLSDLAPLTEMCAILEVHEPRFLRVNDYPSSVIKILEVVDEPSATRIQALPDLPEEEDVEGEFEGGGTMIMPVEPDSKESQDREWLTEVDQLLSALENIDSQIAPSLLEWETEARDGLHVREARMHRYENFEPDRDYSDYASESSGAASLFDIDLFFSDL